MASKVFHSAGQVVPAARTMPLATHTKTEAQRRRSERKSQKRLAVLMANDNINIDIDIDIPPSLEPAACDPGGVFEQPSTISARDFWQWFHAPDGPEGISQGHMGQKWGELWFEFLQMDSLVLAGAVPLILQKRAQMTGVSEDRKIQIAEFRALQRLRQRLECLEPDSIGGLVMSICGRININVQHAESDLAMMHLQAMRRLIDMQQPTGTVWLCSVWTDLRVVSSAGCPPMLDRCIPDGWRTQSPLPADSIQACQRSAMSNMRALGHIGSDRFLLVYGIFKQLHELEIMTAVPVDQCDPPIETLYTTIYDCCLLDADSTIPHQADLLAIQLALLAICLKLCAWEKASRFVPRGGEIERNMLAKANALLGESIANLQSLSKIPGGANANAMLWMLLTLTATAYMFQREELDVWIGRLRAVSSASTVSAFQRALKGWPVAPWWMTHALRRICNELTPKKGQWRVLTDEPDAVPVFMTGLRLKLLVIAP